MLSIGAYWFLFWKEGYRWCFNWIPSEINSWKALSYFPLPFLGDISSQLRTKLRKLFKNILNCSKVQIVFKNQRRLSSQFRFKEPLLYDLMSKVVYKYTCGRCNSSYYGETDRHLRVRAGEHIGLSPLTFKKCKPSKESVVRDHLLFSDNDPSLEEFSVLAKSSSKCSLEVKGSFLIKRDTPNLNRNTTSVELLLFNSR